MKWSKEEIQYINTLAEKYKTSLEVTNNFFAQFPHRSKNTIRTKIREMKLFSPKNPKPCQQCGDIHHFGRGLCRQCYDKSLFMKEIIKKRCRSDRAKAVQVRHYHKYNDKKREEYRERWKKRSEESKLKIKETRLKYSKTLSAQFQAIRKEAFRRNLDCHISKEEYKDLRSKNSCSYCQEPLPSVGHGLDRKSSDLGYFFENVVPCCKSCNSIKSNILTYEEMIVGMSAVLEYRKLSKVK